MPNNTNNANMVQVITGGLSFFGGLFTYMAGARLYSSGRMAGWVYRYRIWKLSRDIDNAYLQNVQDRIEHLNWALTVAKLYSPDFVDQIMAISQLVEANDGRSFEILAYRLCNKPELSDQTKGTLLASLRRIA